MNRVNWRLFIGVTGLVASGFLCIYSYITYTKSNQYIDKELERLESQKELLITSQTALKDLELAFRAANANPGSKSQASIIDDFLTCRSMNKRGEIFAKELIEESIKSGAILSERSKSLLNKDNAAIWSLTGEKVETLIRKNHTTGDSLSENYRQETRNWATTAFQSCQGAAKLYQAITLEGSIHATKANTQIDESQINQDSKKAIELAWIIQIISFTLANLVDIDLNLPL